MNNITNFFKLLTLLLVLTISAKAQVIYKQDFSTGSGYSSKTVGTGSWSVAPVSSVGMTQVDLDGLTPYTTFANVFSSTTGWVVRALTTAPLDSFAVSTSYYTPSGTSNDWLITPSISIPSTGTYFLTWSAAGVDASYLDGYQVKIGTSASPTSMTTLLTVAQENNAWTKHAINLSAYAGQSVYIAFVNNSNDKFLLYLDDIQVEQISGYDAELSKVNVSRFEKANTNVTFTGTVKNNGLPITSLTITWNDGSGLKTSNFTGLNIQPYGSYNFTSTVPFNKSTADEFNISFNIASVNGGATETNTANNTASSVISTVVDNAKKYVFLEEGTGTWCGWCPRGAVTLDSLGKKYEQFIGVAVHNGDPMVLTEYDTNADFSGFPGCNVDRVLLGQSITPALAEGFYNTRVATAGPVSLENSTMTRSGSTLTINAKADFKTKISDVRLAAIVIEDGVKGTASTYNQANYYSSASQNLDLIYNGVNWKNLPNPVLAANMTYNHVGRALLGGYAGQTGSVSNATNGSTSNFTFTYTVPSTSTLSNMKVVVVAIEQTTGQIVNAFEVKAPLAVKNETLNNVNFKVFPNPTKNVLNVSFETLEKSDVLVTIYSLTGQIVKQQSINNCIGAQNTSFNLNDVANGDYLITISDSKSSSTQNFNVSK